MLPNAEGFFDVDLKNNMTGMLVVCDDPTQGQWGWQPQGDSTASPQSILNFCDACVHATTGDVDMSTEYSPMVENVVVMIYVDWLVLSFAGLVVALGITSEVRDIKICVDAVENAGASLSSGWRVALLSLNAVRRVHLPFLVSTVSLLVVVHGGDALSVCLNSIAVRTIRPVFRTS
eukprot:COSAG02_NODE_8583_length_2514_cov_1.493996_3_plen_176_part_00